MAEKVKAPFLRLPCTIPILVAQVVASFSLLDGLLALNKQK